MKLLVTGGAGFIGSAFIRFAIQRCTDIELVNLDKLSYAGNLENLAPIASNDKYRFVHADICDAKTVDAVLGECAFDDEGINYDSETQFK